MENRDEILFKTILLPFYGRAKASRLFPEIFDDVQAREVIEKIDYDFTDIENATKTFVGFSHNIRTMEVEEKLSEYCEINPNASIVDIGSGLDTSFSRVDNGELNWYNLDLPDAIKFRESLIPNEDRVHSVAKSMFDYSWLKDVGFKKENGIIIFSIGVLYFFKEEELKELFINMAEAFPGGEFIFDANSSEGLEKSNKMMRKSGNEKAVMHFSVDDPMIFEKWSDKIKVVEVKTRFRDIERYDCLDDEMIRYMNITDEKGLVIQIHLKFV